jgi:hypothetical protein
MLVYNKAEYKVAGLNFHQNKKRIMIETGKNKKWKPRVGIDPIEIDSNMIRTQQIYQAKIEKNNLKDHLHLPFNKELINLGHYNLVLTLRKQTVKKLELIMLS